MSSTKLSDHVKHCYKVYLHSVVAERALSDIYDGLKPVQRRIIWAAYKMGLRNNKSYIKSARLSGEVMGKYHPHGSSYGSIVGMAQACSVFPLIDGQGGWGFLGDTSSASAERYTEAKLSKIADDILLDEDYLSVTKLIPNYDDTQLEPVRLPAKLPLVLLMGTSGIAVGTRANIPAFTFESLKPILLKSLKTNITYKDCLNLKINDILKAKFVGTKQDWVSYLKTGKGTLKMSSTLKIEGKTIVIKSLSQGLDSALDKLERQDYVKSVSDMSTLNGINILVKFKPQYKESDMKGLCDKIQKLLTNSLNYSLSTNVIKTRADVDVKTESKIVYKNSATYIETTIPNIINSWIKFRVDLEKRMLKNRINKTLMEIKKLKLYILAISKLDIIFKVLKTEKKDLDAKLSKQLKITIDDAKIILDKSVRSLSNMSKDSITKQISKLQSEIKTDKLMLKNPRKTVYNSIKSINI